MDFLTGCPQAVRMGNHTSSTLTQNIETPQGCVLSPVLYLLYTSDCMTKQEMTKEMIIDYGRKQVRNYNSGSVGPQLKG